MRMPKYNRTMIFFLLSESKIKIISDRSLNWNRIICCWKQNFYEFLTIFWSLTYIRVFTYIRLWWNSKINTISSLCLLTVVYAAHWSREEVIETTLAVLVIISSYRRLPIVCGSHTVRIIMYARDTCRLICVSVLGCRSFCVFGLFVVIPFCNQPSGEMKKKKLNKIQLISTI